MTGGELLALVLVILIGIPLIIAYIYGIILAIKLMRRGEWQWFCLPFIGIVLGMFGGMFKQIAFNQMLPDERLENLILGGFALILVALVSGCCVYWLLWRYRKETSFIHFYASVSFLYAAGLMGLIVVSATGRTPGFSVWFLQILPLYGFIVTLSGIAVMRGRVKSHKQNMQNTHDTKMLHE